MRLPLIVLLGFVLLCAAQVLLFGGGGTLVAPPTSRCPHHVAWHPCL